MRSLLVATMIAFSVGIMAAEKDPPNIEELIKQLGSENFDERNRAEEKLIEAGLSAGLALETARDKAVDPEVRLRAKNALAKVLKNAATLPGGMVDKALYWLAF
jgi:hypothetical protein